MRSSALILGCLTVATTGAAQTSTWTLLRPAKSPSAIAWHEMVFDSHRHRTVMFGGGSPFTNKTWQWDGKAWAEIKTTSAPSARWAHAMAFDSLRGRTVIFGGAGSGAPRADTWEFDGTNWTQIKTLASPSPRDSEMVYDSHRHRTVLFGGYTGSSGNLADTWEYDGSNWIQIKTKTSPPARAFQGMVYDPARRRTVMFGGFDAAGLATLGDTWEYDGLDWTQRKPKNAPSARGYHAMAYDSGRRRTVLFGGEDGLRVQNQETWEWDGQNWTRSLPTLSPFSRSGAALAFDPIRQRMVLFGGQNRNLARLSDTWEYDGGTLPFAGSTPNISIATGGTQSLTLKAGADVQGKRYWIFGSATGIAPGVLLTGVHIPLNPDVYTDIVLGTGNSKEFTNFKGTLSATGTATASLNVPAKLPIPVGFKLYHSYVVYDATTGQVFTSSNPVSVEFK